MDINIRGDKGRNVLHTSVNKSAADADQSLDLEMTLLRCDRDSKIFHKDLVIVNAVV